MLKYFIAYISDVCTILFCFMNMTHTRTREREIKREREREREIQREITHASEGEGRR